MTLPPLPEMPSDPRPQMQALPAGPVLVTIGDITVEQYRIVSPAGAMPTRGANWTATDMSRTEERMPAYAVVLAVLFFIFCLLGLLFLLVKERRTVGFVQVSVHSAGRTHSTMVGVNSPHQSADIMARVNFARAISI